MKKNFFQYCLLVGFVCIISFCIFFTKLEAQLWQALPPYNVLWPLWSPVLSPPDPVTGIPTPLVTELDKNTLLPVQPAFIWNPDLPYYNIIYNTLSSYGAPTLMYWDNTEFAPIGVWNGAIFQRWPPSYLLQTIEPYPGIYITIPDTIDLPVGYENLYTMPPYLNWFVPLVNVAWQDWYGIDPYLLTAYDLLGYIL